MRRLVAITILLTSAGFGQKAAEPQIRAGASAYTLTPVVIRAQTNLVPLEVVVRHSDGTVIAKLPKDRFWLSDDGQPQTITTFLEIDRSPELAGGSQPGLPAAAAVNAPALPRTVALWFDDVNTQNRDLQQARNGALRFLRQARDPGDRIGVFTASGAVTLSFTRDSAALLKAVGAIRAHPRASEIGLRESCPRITPFEAYEIAVLRLPSAEQAAQAEACGPQASMDSTAGMGALNPRVRTLPFGTGGAITAQAEATWELTRIISQSTLDDLRAVLAALSTQPGKRILLMASSGFLTETLGNEEDDLVKSALHDQIVINALDAEGLYTEEAARPLGQESDAGILPLITFFYEFTSQLDAHQEAEDVMVTLAQATGGLYFHNNNDLTLGFERLGLEPPVVYELAFSPAAMPPDGQFHTLDVKLTPPVKGAVIQARRGYFDPPPLTAVAALQSAIDAAMRSTAGASGLPAQIKPEPGPGRIGVHIEVDVARLPFIKRGGRERQLLIATAGLFTPAGQWVTGEQGILNLALDSRHYQQFRRTGLGSTLKLAAAPGTYRLRVVVGEAGAGKFSAYTRTVTIP